MNDNCSFERICSMLAARDLFFNNVDIKDIAKQAKQSITTIQEWIKTSLNVHSWETCCWLKDHYQQKWAEELRIQPEFDF